MADYSLVPVDYQPDFGNVSLVPVDYDPFAGDGVTQRAQHAQQTPTQVQQPAPAQPQNRPQQPATGVGAAPSNVGTPVANPEAVPATNEQSTESGESWDPDSENKNDAAPTRPNPPTPTSNYGTRPVDPERIRQFGELKR